MDFFRVDSLDFWLKITMNNINIYLHFPGSCEQAFAFYEQVFQTAISMKSYFKEMPENENCQVTDADKNKIMHISLPLNDHFILMGCDAVGQAADIMKEGNNFAVSVNPSDFEEAKRVFEALSVNGQVCMPLEKSFWGSYFGMLTDQFGINWMVNYEIPQDHKDNN